MRRLSGVVFLILGMLSLAPSGLNAQGAAAAPHRMTSWLASSRNFQVGEIVTIFVEERALAEEQTSRVASNDRSQGGAFSTGGASATSISMGLDRSSRARGELSRSAGLRGVMSARITEVGANGVLKLEGRKLVIIDGREQSWTITGSVRSEDVSPSNEVASSRIADGKIEYNGESIQPSSGILGKILGIFWP